jgi:hypothetical protein
VTQHALRLLTIGLGVVASSPALAGHPDVFILPLSSAIGPATHLTQDACAALAEQLSKLKVSATVAEPTPAWEELAASANASGPRLTLGLRVNESSSCPTVVAPKRVTAPSTPPMPEGAPLQQAILDATEAARTGESASLAVAIAQQGRWCSGRPTRPEAYVLSNVRSPVVVVTLPSKRAADLSLLLAAALAQAVRREHP